MFHNRAKGKGRRRAASDPAGVAERCTVSEGLTVPAAHCSSMLEHPGYVRLAATAKENARLSVDAEKDRKGPSVCVPGV
jgi:hypothetical protein